MKLTIIFILFSLIVFSQKKETFTGKLVYEISMVDTSLQKVFPTREMVIYTNDTIVRIENETQQFGKQIVIKHTTLNKSYLLLNDGQNKFAIQTDLNKTKKDSTTFKPIYKKKCGKTTFLGHKANRILVTTKENTSPIEVLYLKHLSPKYIDAFKDTPGLPVKYTLRSNEGDISYKLIKIEKSNPEHDLFGIPSDYKKVSFDDFLEIIYMNKNNESSPK